MWRKIKEILCKHTVAHKDESATKTTMPSTITGSVIDLKPSPLTSTSTRRTETLYHHQQHQHRPYRKATNRSTLNKTDEHCRSLFNLFPTSIRSRQQTSKNRGIDASTTTNTTQASPSIDLCGTDYDSGYMSQSVLNRTSSYASCYSAVAITTPVSSMVRYGSIESLLHGHSKSNPAQLRVLIRKNFEPFAQAHIAVTKGMIVTALFARGPWLYIRIESNGQTGYIPRIICSLYKHRSTNYHVSISSTDSSSIKDDELDLTTISPNHQEKYFIRPYQQRKQRSQPKEQINRHLSQSSAMINDQATYVENAKKTFLRMNADERERRNTCTLPPPPPLPSPLSTTMHSSKDRRLTLNTTNWPINSKKSELVGIHQINDAPTNTTMTTATTTTTTTIPIRDTDSSSTQDSGYSESASYFLVQQTTPDNDQQPSMNLAPSPQYAVVRRSSLLKVPDPINTQHHSLRRQPVSSIKGSTRSHPHRHTLLNGISMTDMITNDINKRHSFGTFYTNFPDPYEPMISTTTTPTQRPIEFALIRNVRREQDDLYQRVKPSIHNLPKSHRQIPASIFLHHHRQHNHHHQQQQQQFGSSHSAFRPVQPSTKSKRASSEGHSPSNDEQRILSLSLSSSSSSIASSTSSSVSNKKNTQLNKHRRLSCDLPLPKLSKGHTNSLTRSVCDSIATKKLNAYSRTMSDILCDQFSEINLDAIEKDSLQQLPTTNKSNQDRYETFTILKDYRSSRASFSVKRGDRVHVIKQAGRACFLVRKQANGQVGFLPKALMIPTTKTRVDTFLEMHGYQETVI